MEAVFAVLKYLVLGFFGLIGLLVVLALVFGKRVVKQWEYEADFRDERGREFGEFDLELSRIEKEQPNFTLKAKFRMRHEALKLHQTVQIFLEQTLVLQGMVTTAGRVYLTEADHLQNEPADPQVGQVCRVVVGGAPLFEQPLELD